MSLCAVTHRKEDAVRKWCPFAWSRSACSETALAAGYDPPDQEQYEQDDKVRDNCCMTNNCMAWIDETNHFCGGIAMGRCGLVTLSRM